MTVPLLNLSARSKVQWMHELVNRSRLMKIIDRWSGESTYGSGPTGVGVLPRQHIGVGLPF